MLYLFIYNNTCYNFHRSHDDRVLVRCLEFSIRQSAYNFMAIITITMNLKYKIACIMVMREDTIIEGVVAKELNYISN